MVVMSKQNVPALRLEGFSGEWEVSPLSEISELNPSASVPAHFEYVDLASVLGTEMISHQSTSSSEAPSRAQRVARYGDIFYQTVRPYQKNNYHFMIDSDCDFVFSTGYAQIRPLIDGEFLFTAVQREDFLVQVLDRCTGTGYPAIAPNALGKIQLSYPPTLEEQQAIGAIFTNLDAAINQHTLKHKALQQSKTALMQRMFPQEGQTAPELRLEGFDGEWEDCTLGEHSHVTTGSSDVQDADPDGLYPFFVRSQHVERSNKYLFDGEAILIPGEGRLGEIFHYYIGKFDFHQRVYRISDFEDIDGKYVYWAMQHSFKDHAMKNTVKATVDSLRQPTITGFIFQKPPTLEEQQAIGAVFTNLDQLIVAEAQYIKSLKQAKTALLQRMFI